VDRGEGAAAALEPHRDAVTLLPHRLDEQSRVVRRNLDEGIGQR
jgi:hypothetical protein